MHQCQAKTLERDAIIKPIPMTRVSGWMARVSVVLTSRKKKSAPSIAVTPTRVIKIIINIMRRRKEALLTQELPRETSSTKIKPSMVITTVISTATHTVTDISNSNSKTRSPLLSMPSN